MIDRIVRVEKNQAIEGAKMVTLTEDFFEHHFPGNPVMPGILMIETMVQLAAWLEAVSSDFSRWFLLSHVKKCNFSRKVVPGDALEISVERLPDKQDGLSHFKGAGAVEKTRCFSGNFAGIAVSANDLFETDDLRRRFSRLMSPIRRKV